MLLPLPQRPFARWGYRYPNSDAVSICVVGLLNATVHPQIDHDRWVYGRQLDGRLRLPCVYSMVLTDPRFWQIRDGGGVLGSHPRLVPIPGKSGMGTVMGIGDYTYEFSDSGVRLLVLLVTTSSTVTPASSIMMRPPPGGGQTQPV